MGEGRNPLEKGINKWLQWFGQNYYGQVTMCMHCTFFMNLEGNYALLFLDRIIQVS